MLRSLTKKIVSVVHYASLIIVVLLGASCSRASVSMIEDPSSNSLTEQTAGLPTTIPKILPGQHLRFEHFSLENGLSQSTIFCMVQDNLGFMWYGTEDGLNKFDGYTFTVYKNAPDDPNSLSGNWILSIFEDRSGRLWIGTRGGGLEQYDRERDQFIHYRNDPGDPASLSDNEITAIYQDERGVIWVGTANRGLNKLNQDEATFTHYQYESGNPNSLSSNAVTVILEDQEGILWGRNGERRTEQI